MFQSAALLQSMSIFCRTRHTKLTRHAVWDPKNLRKPLAVASGLPNRYPETNLVYSPDGRSIITGIAPANKGEKGALVFLDSETLVEQRRVAIGEGTVVRVLWHSRINQVREVTRVPLFPLHLSAVQFPMNVSNVSNWP